MKISFVGLGQMGKPMAINLIKSGAQLTVYSRRTNNYPEFEEMGARTTVNLREVAQGDIIFLCLPDSEVVYEFLFGENGIAKDLQTGQVIVDFSTIKYTTAIEIAKALKELGVGFIDAPITGMEARAKDGTLTVMCGGDREVFESVLPYLKYVGNKILHMGSSGAGQLTKVINNVLLNINLAALAEILPLATKLGLDPEKVSEVINSGSGGSYVSKVFLPKILEGSFEEGYPMNKAYKDLVSAAEISANFCIPTPILSAATNTYQMALLSGHADKDKGGMICVFEDLLGVKFRKQ